ncbi:hypothetical protein BCT47_02450 [Vibrio splendidus]|jgi:hypothetical protein|nr:hypothetical protein A152_05905 [Vibrio tasmaniensis 1F-187]OEF81642.1 hypothetical protein A162_13405 [Vibrio tasmaniensis 1F-155]PMG52401.1 hypothetical protein BCU89_03495 [Vibrio splendidus]PMJ38042.1 hypothetical protein BCU24_21520 [Vibrio cyclitrophicus]PMO81462.1 hypothetical protein BCT01_01440 [Vibrio tasmaniensis]
MGVVFKTTLSNYSEYYSFIWFNSGGARDLIKGNKYVFERALDVILKERSAIGVGKFKQVRF